jgi:hypothetical protein
VNSKRVYVECVNLAVRSHQFNEGHDVAAGTATEIEHRESGFYSGFCQHRLTRPEKITDFEHKSHQPEADMRHGTVFFNHFRHTLLLPGEKPPAIKTGLRCAISLVSIQRFAQSLPNFFEMDDTTCDIVCQICNAPIGL